MKKLENIKLNKKTVIVISVVCVVIIMAVVLAFILLKGDSQEKVLTKKLEEMGVDFYENFYYEQRGANDEERSEFLKEYKEIGIKINLDNLSRYDGNDSEEILKEFKNNQTKKSCDKDSTQVIIYPQDPYDKKSYKIEVELVCGFEEE